MKKAVPQIVAESAKNAKIEYWGACPFEPLKNALLPCRAAGRLPENPRAVIVFLFPYLLEDSFYEARNISRYAVPPDYHESAGAILSDMCARLREDFPEYSFEPFCDNSPIPEVKAAAMCGLGAVGENTLLINEKYGSWVFIGEIVTDCPDFETENRAPQACLKCGMCRKKCPAGAISENGVDRSTCLSAVSQKKGALTENEEAMIEASGCAWGCDICSEICPMNKNASVTPIEEFRQNTAAQTEEGASLDSRAFAWRGKAVIERNLSIITKRNKL